MTATLTPPMDHTFSTQVDGMDPGAWEEVLTGFDDATIYQSWAYGAVRWGAARVSHLVLRRDGEVVAAAQLRIARVPVLPLGVAYLRWGPLCRRRGLPLEPASLDRM